MSAPPPGPDDSTGDLRGATEIDRLLAQHGWQINTAFVERLNLTLRQHVAAIGRRVIGADIA